MLLQSTHRRPFAGVYARKSDPDEQGIKDQFALAEHRATIDGFIIPDDPIFRIGDDFTSGVSLHREGLTRLRELARNRELPFNRLYVKDSSRFGRWEDPRRRFALELEFQDAGIELIYVESNIQPGDFGRDTDGAMVGNWLSAAFDSAKNSDERRTIRRRTRGGRNKRTKDGFFVGGRAPYGAEVWLVDARLGTLVEAVQSGRRLSVPGCHRKLVWREHDEPYRVIQRIYRELLAGESLHGIAQRLTQEGITAPGADFGKGRRGSGKWDGSTLSGMVRNPIYKGLFIWGRETRAKRGSPVPAIEASEQCEVPIIGEPPLGIPPVSEAEWEAVQSILARNAAARTRSFKVRPEYPLSAVIICQHCSGRFSGHTGHADRGKQRYYRHKSRPNRDGSVCPSTHRYVRAEFLEECVRAIADDLSSDQRLVCMTRELLERRFSSEEVQRNKAACVRVVEELEQFSAARAAAARELTLASGSNEKLYRDLVTEYGQQVDRLTARLAELQAEALRIEEARNDESAFATLPGRIRALLRENVGLGAIAKLLIDSIVLDQIAGTARIRVRTVTDVTSGENGLLMR